MSKYTELSPMQQIQSCQLTFGIAAIFAISAVWVPALHALSGFAWVFGAALGAALHWLVSRGRTVGTPDAERAAVS